MAAARHIALACLVCLAAMGACAESGSNSTLDSCDLAMAAQTLLLNVGAVSKMMAPPFTEHPQLVPSMELLGLLANASKAERDLGRAPNLARVFSGTPYDFWGNGMFQTAISQAIHVPSATLGEMMYACSSTMELYAAAAAEAAKTDSSVPSNQTFAFWTDSWMAMSNSLVKQAEDMKDVLSKRALLLRSMNYAYAAYYPVPTHPDYLDMYRNASKSFKEAMDLFGAYQTSFFQIPYDNGTTQGNLEAFLVTPSLNTPSPTLIFLGSAYNWKEVQFMRYGLAALRRNYAVMFMDQPGQGFAIREYPHFAMDPDMDAVVGTALDVMEEKEDLAKLVDFEQVVIVGISIGSYGALQACSKLMPSRVAGCVVNPGIHDLGALATRVLSTHVYGALARVARETPDAYGDEALAEVFTNPAENILLPLLKDCPPESGAAALLGAMLQGTTDPELLYPPLFQLGLVNSTAQELAAHYFGSVSRVVDEFGALDLSDMEGQLLILGGEQDYGTGGQEAELAELVDEDKVDVRLAMFGPETGAALNTQIGSVTWWELEVFPWLTAKVFGGRAEAAGRRRRQ